MDLATASRALWQAQAPFRDRRALLDDRASRI
jgi:hypothetical protein